MRDVSEVRCFICHEFTRLKTECRANDHQLNGVNTESKHLNVKLAAVEARGSGPEWPSEGASALYAVHR